MIKKSSIIFSLFVLLYANSFFAASKIDSIQTNISLPTIIAIENVVIISDETSSDSPDLEVPKEETAVFLYNGAFLFDTEKIASSKYVYLEETEKKGCSRIKKEEIKQTTTLKKNQEVIKEKASTIFIANPRSSQTIFCNVTADILFFISHSHHVLKNEAVFHYSLPNIQTYFYSEKIYTEGSFISSLFSHYYFLRPPPSI